MIIHEYGEYAALSGAERRLLGIAFRAARECEETSGWFPRWVVVPRSRWTVECRQFDIGDFLRVTPSPVDGEQILCLRELPKLPDLNMPVPVLEPFFRPWIPR